MHLPATIRTTFGPRSIGLRPMIRLSLTIGEAHMLALALEREAAAAEREGAHAAARRLRWRAAVFREAAR